VAESPGAFAGVLRELRVSAGLTQEELAEAAGLSLRTVGDLERGAAATPQRETVRLLADALGLIGPARARFEAVARGRPVAGGVAATRALPRDIASFTGRRQELEQLAGDAGGVVGIHAIGGMAGIGKTAFAVHAAHRLADQFPGGQVFLSLHGHTPGQQPVDPMDALASLLLTAGVAAAQIPPGLEARMALWRDRVAGRRLVLILDDAAGSEQVRPLLPGDGGSLVLVTSRRHLSALDDARMISLDTLPPDEAASLLVRLAGRPGLSPSDPGAREIVGLCGCLPLAIGMVARQLRHHPAWSAAGRAAELTAARDRLELMATENLSVAAAFDLSYAQLTEEQQRLFRRLGLHPGAEFDGYAAAALDSTGLPVARRGLEDLYDQYLLTEPAHGRYRMHDLIREHARALADRDDPGEDRDAATSRLLDYYEHTAGRANAFIARQPRAAPAAAVPVLAQVPVLAEVPVLDDLGQALAWARAERASLLACLDHAARTGQHARVIALTAGISGLLQGDGPWAEAIARFTAAIAAARQLGDRPAEASALNDLGAVRQLTDDYPAAARDLEEALSICRDLGDRRGQANALNGLGLARWLTGDYPAAARDAEEALGLYRDIGDRRGQANALNFLGTARWERGDYPAAVQAMQQALGIYRDIGDRQGQAIALTSLGGVLPRTGDLPAAAQALERALGAYRDIGDRLGQATALTSLGSVRWERGDYPAAVQALQEALGLHRDIGNRLGEAMALTSLGAVLPRTGDLPAAVQDLEEALGLHRDIGNRLGQATALNYLGVARRLTGDYRAAARDLEQGLGVYRELGNRVGEALALLNLGAVGRLAGDVPAAVRDLEEALAVFRDLGERSGEVTVLNERGTLHRVNGENGLAQRCHQQALELARAIASRWDEAHALAGLGRCVLAAGDVARAESLIRQALGIFQQMGATAEALNLLTELDALASP
jgi:tetratricopeptide (TPR) repeat protein/transcriptional regulator with XRE-family HTH domain